MAVHRGPNGTCKVNLKPCPSVPQKRHPCASLMAKASWSPRRVLGNLHHSLMWHISCSRYSQARGGRTGSRSCYEKACAKHNVQGPSVHLCYCSNPVPTQYTYLHTSTAELMTGRSPRLHHAQRENWRILTGVQSHPQDGYSTSPGPNNS